MAEQYDDSIFSGIFKALRRTRKDDNKEGDRSILTNAPLSNQFSSKQQKQQDFLDIQSKKISEDLYSRSMYYEADRFTAYQDYRAMDNSPEVSAALDILSDECVTKSEKGEILGIYSDNSRVKSTLKDLFYNVLNVNYNLGFWTRELLKFGDAFIKLEVDQQSGIYDAIMLPVGEIHRIENKSEELGTSKFKWDTNNLYFEEWQVAHFRLISDHNRLPYGRCLKFDTYIDTTDGVKFIKDIKKGDFVYSFDTTLQKLIPSKVLDTVYSGKKNIYKIRTRNNEIETSIEHKFLVCDNGEFCYKLVSELNVDDLLVINKEIKTNKKVKINKIFDNDRNFNGYRKTTDNVPDYVNKEFAMLYGFLLGDGWTHNNTVQIALGVDKEINKKYINLLEKFSGNDITLVKNLNDKGLLRFSQALVNSKMLKEILIKNEFVGKCFEKRLPSWIFNAERNIQEALIEGLIDSDGSVFVDKWNCKRYSIEVVSEYLIKDLKTLLQRMGRKTGKICSRDRKKVSFWGVEYDRRKSFYFYFYDSHITQCEKHDNIERESDEFVLTPITSIENTETKEEVYDIYVENSNHNFCANGIIVHNSVLEPARKLWRQLQLAEDAMLVYRAVRAPERRVFYIEVGNIDPSDVPQYMEKSKASVKKTPMVEQSTGNVNLKFAPMTYEEDFFLPVRGDKSSRIETLPGACLTLETRIELLDGRSVELKNIIKEFESGKELWSYSINPKTGEIVPGRISWAGVTRKNTQVVKITLDNGETIISTPDHKFPTRFNGIKEAKDLIAGESMWSFNKSITEKDHYVFDHSENKYIDFNNKIKNFSKQNNLPIIKTCLKKNFKKQLSVEECFNHKIVSVEWLEEKQDTGTITIDGNELYHDFHNFALTCGIFTQNSNLSDIADIEYLQNKLFAALKVPKPYLNYAETIPGGSALSQADLRFSRTINRLQQFLVIELRRVANIHLYFLGFEDDINNFEITLTNPSTQQELLKLETMKARLEVFKEFFTNEPTSPTSYTWAMQYIMGFSEAEIKQILRQKKIERKMFSEIEGAADEYTETGIFNELDRKFRKPGFVPGATPAGGSEGADAGADAGGGGGGSSLGGLGGGLDLGGGGGLGGGADVGADAGTDAGADAGADPNADAGTDAGDEPLSENKKRKNNLQKNNAAVNHRTKIMMENIEKHLKSLNDGTKEKGGEEIITG